MLTELQKRERELLYKKELLLNEVNKIDLELENIQKKLNTYIKPQEYNIKSKPKNNNDILSLLRNIDDEDDCIFDFLKKTKKTENTSSPIVTKTLNTPSKITVSNILDKFTFLDVTYEIKSIEEILIKVCEILISKSPYKVANFTKDNQLNNKENINFSFNELDIKSSKHRLSNGIWVKINSDCDDVINISNKLLEICGY